MTEDATNAEEWGPTTTAMASISDAAYNSEDYLRIVQVLHKRWFSFVTSNGDVAICIPNIISHVKWIISNLGFYWGSGVVLLITCCGCVQILVRWEEILEGDSEVSNSSTLSPNSWPRLLGFGVPKWQGPWQICVLRVRWWKHVSFCWHGSYWPSSIFLGSWFGSTGYILEAHRPPHSVNLMHARGKRELSHMREYSSFIQYKILGLVCSFGGCFFWFIWD